MSTTTKKLFHEKISSLLDKYNLEEIKQIILNMTENIKPENRDDFLSKLELKTDFSILLEYDILPLIDELISDIREDKYQDEWNKEENYEENGNLWQDECNLSAESDLFEEIEYLFVECSKLYEAKEYKITFPAFEKLFELIEMGDDGYYPSLSNSSTEKLQLKEVIMKYIQSAYYITKSSERSSVVLKLFKEHSYYINEETFLSDLDGVSIIPLPEFNKCLLNIIESSNNNVLDVPKHIYLEAVKLLEGKDGLRRLIETKDKKNAKSYLVLLKELHQKEQYDEVIEIATKGIKSISINDCDRAKIADFVTIVGKRDSDVRFQQLGLITSIESDPRISKLIDLYDISEDNRQEIYDKILKRFVILNKNKKMKSNIPYCTDRLLAQAAIFVKDIPLVIEISEKHNPLGWSDFGAPSGIAIAVMLKLLSKIDKKVGIIDELIIWELERTDYLNQKKSLKFIEILNSIHSSCSLTSEQITEYRNWCNNKIEERGHAILKNKYRFSYYKVAHLLTALREMYYSSDLSVQGDELIIKFNREYPRHRAFKTELDIKLNESIY